MLSVPFGSWVVVKAAVAATVPAVPGASDNVAVPTCVLPDRKFTFPVGALPLLLAVTVAVSVTGWPTRPAPLVDCTEVCVAAKPIVIGNGAELLGLKLKSP